MAAFRKLLWKGVAGLHSTVVRVGVVQDGIAYTIVVEAQFTDTFGGERWDVVQPSDYQGELLHTAAVARALLHLHERAENAIKLGAAS